MKWEWPETSEPSPSDRLPLARPCLLTHPNRTTNWLTNIQMSMMMRAISFKPPQLTMSIETQANSISASEIWTQTPLTIPLQTDKDIAKGDQLGEYGQWFVYENIINRNANVLNVKSKRRLKQQHRCGLVIAEINKRFIFKHWLFYLDFSCLVLKKVHNLGRFNPRQLILVCGKNYAFKNIIKPHISPNDYLTVPLSLTE